ncbi:helix-turn-helix domain-containing protein [Kitasatospora sp. CB01950]|uniref:helix-turn-helix domain-containing protein n=1 Tax=Kitasatospora sp. CB01950 TaxID=1703930 RepID=UPI000AB531F2|nr:helix-turn-helix domain-containing protein [Kitasatospora sp. CB01950]
MAAEIIREIRCSLPEFARPISGQFGTGIQQGLETALAEFVDRLAGLPAPTPRQLRIYRALGRAEFAEGRSLDALQAAFRLGARIIWRRYSRVARRLGLGPERLVTLAEAVFTHIDEVTAAAVRGYLDARTDRAGTLARARHRLLALLLSDAPHTGPDGTGPTRTGPAGTGSTATGPDAADLADAAQSADWPLPALLAAVSLDPRTPAPLPTARQPLARIASFGSRPPGDGRLPDHVLADLESPQPHLLLPDPATTLADPRVAGALQGRGAVIGPAVPPALAAQSLRWARLLRASLPKAPDQPVDCRDHLTDLLLLTDPSLVRLIAERRLAPLAPLTPKQRDRLAATLLAWLQTGRGTAPQVAARLGIHPQTARQRLHRVHRLFGPSLASPNTRLELEVALRATTPP